MVVPFRIKNSKKIRKNLKRKERRKMKKLHANYGKEILEKQQNIDILQNKMESVNNELIMSKALSKKPNLVASSSFINCKQIIATGPCLSKSSKDSKKKLGQLLPGIPRFKNADIEILYEGICIGKGQFGQIKLVKLNRLNTVVACKEMSKMSSRNDVLGEVITGLTVSGEKYFPFTYGMLNENAILMEYFGDLGELNPKSAPSLYEHFKDSACSKKEFTSVLVGVLNGVIALHGFKILHNDLKADNFICAKDCVKVIDFGKATIFSYPKTYNIVPGSELADKYNKYHRHLAYELRNIPGSKQSILTDTYSVGFMFKHLGAKVGCKEMISLGKHMKNKDPGSRVSLNNALNICRKVNITLGKSFV